MSQYRFVILIADPQALPKRLIAGLDQRGVKIATAFDAPWTMVELAQGAQSLIITEPWRVTQLKDLIEAVRQYHPHTTFWQYGREVEGEPAPTLAPMFTTRTPPQVKTPEIMTAPVKPVQVSAPAVEALQHQAAEVEAASSIDEVDAAAREAVTSAPVVREADHEAVERDREHIMVPPPPTDTEDADDMPAMDGEHTMFANTDAAGHDSQSHEAEEQFRQMMSQVHERVLRSPLPFMVPDEPGLEPERSTPLISPEEMAMLLGPLPARTDETRSDDEATPRHQGDGEDTA